MFKRNIAILTAACAVATASASALAQCDEWQAFIAGGQTGVGPQSVYSLRQFEGDLIASGVFTTAGGQTVNRIARWDGATWHPFISNGVIGISGAANDMVEFQGDLVAGGTFVTAGGQTVNRIARWDGTQWQPFASGGQTGVNGGIQALAVYKGDLIVGGDFAFTTAGGQLVNHIARWDGTSWHPIIFSGEIGVSGNVYALTVYNGDLIVGGSFTTAGGITVNRIARWDGSAWHPFVSGEQIGVDGPSFVWDLIVYGGDLFAAGSFGTAGGKVVNGIARWDGSHWHALASGGQIGVSVPDVRSLAVVGGRLIVGGGFLHAGGELVRRIAIWDGSEWHALGSGDEVGVNSFVRAVEAFEHDTIAGGSFTTAANVGTVNAIARWKHCPPCPPGTADLNCDGVVGVADLLMLLAAWGPCAECVPGSPDPSCLADLNHDCTVGVADLLILLSAWG